MLNYYDHGFSLLELLVTLTITSLLLSFALPAWTNFHARIQAKLITEEIISSLNYARLLAVLDNQVTQIKPIQNNFQNGWEILENNKIIKLYSPLPKNIHLTTEQFSRNNIINFQPNGMSEGSNGNFQINDYYKITLNRGGRVYWEKMAPVIPRERQRRGIS